MIVDERDRIDHRVALDRHFRSLIVGASARIERKRGKTLGATRYASESSIVDEGEDCIAKNISLFLSVVKFAGNSQLQNVFDEPEHVQ